MKQKIAAFFLATTLIFSITGCGTKGVPQDNSISKDSATESSEIENMKDENLEESSHTEQKKEVTAYVGTNIFEGSLDPVKGAMSYGYSFTSNALLKVNSNSEYEGDLAESYNISDDALTYTFQLKKGITFSDGSDFNAEDVVFTYETVHNNQANNENVDLTRLESVRAVDDYTVEFLLKEPYSPFFDIAAMLQIVPSDIYDSDTFDTMPIGTGPWKVVQYDSNQQIILEANENYYEGAPKLDKVTLVYMDQDAAFAAAGSGQLDIVMVGANYGGETIAGMTLESFETMDVRNVSLPVREEQTLTDSEGKEVTIGNNVTSDKAVRQALSVGIDRSTIIEHAFNGVGVPAKSFTKNLVWANAQEVSDGDRQQAAQILEDAGWVDEDGDGIREKNGVKSEFTVYAPGGDNDRYLLAVALAEDAMNLGIHIDVKTATWDEIITLQNTCGVVWGWGQYSPTVLYSLFQSDLFLTGGYDNVVGYDNPAVDDKISEALSSNNQEDAIKAWKEVQQMADGDVPYLYLVNIEHCYFVKDGLNLSKDTQIPHPHGHGSPIICNMKDWSWTEE